MLPKEMKKKKNIAKMSSGKIHISSSLMELNRGWSQTQASAAKWIAPANKGE